MRRDDRELQPVGARAIACSASIGWRRAGLRDSGALLSLPADGRRRAIEGVLEHNRHDLVSLAAVMSHALGSRATGPRRAASRRAAGAWPALRARRRHRRARSRAYELAARRTAIATSAAHALARWRCCIGATARHDEAAAAWQGVLDLARRRGAALDAARAPRGRGARHPSRASRARSRRGASATPRRCAAHATGRAAADAAHRLGRIDRKTRATRRHDERPSAADCDDQLRRASARLRVALVFLRLGRLRRPCRPWSPAPCGPRRVCAPNRFVNRSTRPSVSISFWRPVKNGWHVLQISRCSSGLVERVLNVLPHAHRTSTSWYFG